MSGVTQGVLLGVGVLSGFVWMAVGIISLRIEGFLASLLGISMLLSLPISASLHTGLWKVPMLKTFVWAVVVASVGIIIISNVRRIATP